MRGRWYHQLGAFIAPVALISAFSVRPVHLCLQARATAMEQCWAMAGGTFSRYFERGVMLDFVEGGRIYCSIGIGIGTCGNGPVDAIATAAGARPRSSHAGNAMTVRGGRLSIVARS